MNIKQRVLLSFLIFVIFIFIFILANPLFGQFSVFVGTLPQLKPILYILITLVICTPMFIVTYLWRRNLKDLIKKI